jgi:hypothetical protein
MRHTIVASGGLRDKYDLEGMSWTTVTEKDQPVNMTDWTAHV